MEEAHRGMGGDWRPGSFSVVAQTTPTTIHGTPSGGEIGARVLPTRPALWGNPDFSAERHEAYYVHPFLRSEARIVVGFDDDMPAQVDPSELPNGLDVL
eukprot:4768972-Lingulodinium_polyedra.AAC.1